MKTWMVIVVCFIAGVLLYSYFWNDLNIVVPRSYNFFGCKVKYKQTILSSDYNRLNENIEEENSAKYKLAICLCEKYSDSQDSSIGNFIEAFYNNDEYAQKNYALNLVFNYLDTNFLMKNLHTIFKDDARVLQKIRQHSSYGNEDFAKELIQDLNQSYWADYRYKELLLSIPVDNPPLDTIVRYRELIFKYP